MSLSAAYLAWANDPGAEKVIAAVLCPVLISSGVGVDFFWASMGGWWDGEHWFEPVILGGFSLELSTQIISHGVSRPSYGSLRLGLVSGAAVDQHNLVSAGELVGGDYAWTGQPLTIYSGGPDLDWADWAVVFNGYSGQLSPSGLPYYGRDEAVFRRQAPPNVYVGL